MKKISFILSACALAFASCSNDTLIDEPIVNNVAEQAIGFQVYKPNMSRAGSAQLETETFDFGVWAYKGVPASAGAHNPEFLVMPAYLVGWTDGTTGYKNLQTKYGSDWVYEGFGKKDNATEDGPLYTFVGNAVQGSANPSLNDHQYLKYWDGTAGMHTFFYAVAPYSQVKAVNAFDNTTETMQVSDLEMTIGVVGDDDDICDWGSTANLMFAYADIDNSTMYKQTGKTVNLAFQRIGAKIRMAFYETIPGWNVEIIGYSTGNDHIYAVPAKATTVDEVTTYSAGEYTYKYAGSALDFTAAPETITLTGGTATKTGNAIIAPRVFYKNGAMQTGTVYLGSNNAVADLMCTGYKKVVPAQTGANANDGFTLNVSFKLVAEDTNEEIYVRGARVFVPADKCQWENNKAYTYVFKITNNVPGQVTDPGTPSPEPNTNPGLWPIVFNDVVIEDMTEVVVTPEYEL